MTNSRKIEEIVAEQFPPKLYPYFVSIEQLLQSTNSYIAEARRETPSEQKFILNQSHINPDNLHQLKKDLAREIEIEGVYKKRGQQMTEEDIQSRLKEELGEANLALLIKEYSQIQSYLSTEPFKAAFKEGPDEDVDPENNLGAKNPDNVKQKIFMIDDKVFREVIVDYIYIKVPEDREFILPEKLKEIEVANNERKKNGEKEYTAREKTDKLSLWQGFWKYSINLKNLSVLTENGFEVLGMGSNSPLAFNVMLDRENPRDQIMKIINAVVGVEKENAAKIADMMNKQQKEVKAERHDSSRKLNADDKSDILTDIAAAIALFKLGTIQFEELVREVKKLHAKANEVEHTNPLKRGLESISIGFFGDKGKIQSPTAKLIGTFVKKLEEVQKDVEKIANPDEVRKEVDEVRFEMK